jgi:hypothetical protein
MADRSPQPDSKVHPATREILPDDPLEMQGFELPGDPELMVRLLVEEYSRIGWGTQAIMQLARDPNYQAFHGLLRYFGDEPLAARVAQIVGRCGIMRVRLHSAAPPPESLVQIEIN